MLFTTVTSIEYVVGLSFTIYDEAATFTFAGSIVAIVAVTPLKVPVATNVSSVDS